MTLSKFLDVPNDQFQIRHVEICRNNAIVVVCYHPKGGAGVIYSQNTTALEMDEDGRKKLESLPHNIEL